ncbi:MAG: arginine--tRNA ligase [Candidatus Micrarchaeia archaeon]
MEGTPYSNVTSSIVGAIKRVLAEMGYAVKEEELFNSISISKIIGDFSSSICFKLAKQHSTDPISMANRLKESISRIGIPGIEKVTADNGYLNFHLDRRKYAEDVLSYVGSMGKMQSRNDRIAIVEFPSVNPNKPWHIGHLRNALIGDMVASMLEHSGYKVLRTDYIDDLGLQIAESVWWHIKSNASLSQGKKFDHWLGEEYVNANKYMEEHKDAHEEVDKVLRLMEQDGTYESKIARELSEACVKAQYETAFSYGIYHDLMVWESDIVRNRFLEKSLELLLHSRFAKKVTGGEYNNCIVIDLSSSASKEFKGLQESVKVLVRSNGVPTYLAKDIAFHMWKFGMIEDTFNYVAFEKQPNGKDVYSTSINGEQMKFVPAVLSVNVIDARQSYPQALLRLAFEAMGKSEIANSIIHLAYGEVEVEGGELSGRKGTWIGYSADELLQEAKEKALELIKGKFSFSKEEQERVAKSVGLAAIKFEFLKLGIEKKIVFSWERALNFEGDSGPYLQYTYARASRILEECNAQSADPSALKGDYDFALLKSISRFQDLLEKAAREYRPNMIVDYAIELADTFSRFYEHCPVLKAEEPLRSARILLLGAFRKVMKNVLEIIGIEALERM